MSRFNDENNLPELDREFLILVEGMADFAFVEALLTERGIRDRCYLGFPDGPKKGKDGFGEYLIGLRIKTARPRNRVRRLLIIRDSDDDPDAAFKQVVDCIREANGELEASRH